MAGDNLFAILGVIRAELGDAVSDAAWEQIRRMLSDRAGGSRPYVPREPKRGRLEALAAADQDVANADLARRLGVSVRQTQRLKRLR